VSYGFRLIDSRARERVRTSPEDGGVAKKMAAFMAAELGLVRVAEQRGWEALRAIDYTLQRPRPRGRPRGAGGVQKTSPMWSPRRRHAIPARRSRPSPPTNTASG
jgi:hypothetical protein